MEGKSEDEVERYAEVFRKRYKELNGTCVALCAMLIPGYID